MPWGIAAAAGIGAIGSIASGAMASSGQQAAASTNAAAMAKQQAMAAPFVQVGTGAAQDLYNELGLAAPGTATLGVMPSLDTNAISQMPGYQFTLNQGLLSTQNAAAARGLGVSGAALMGAANYATGLAQSNFQNYFSDYWANQNNRYNQLAGLAGMGANAAVGAGSNIGQSAAATGQAQAGAGAAQAAGISGGTNSLSNALMLNQLMNPSNTGSTISQSQNLANAAIGPGGGSGDALG